MDVESKVVTNFLWKFFERIGAQGVTFVVSIILARILDPAVYGTIALVTVIMSIMQVFIEGGFGTALIQKKDADNVDFSSVFYFNIIFALFLYALLFFSAPLVASFYERAELTKIIRVLGLTLIISGVKNVQHAYVSRKLLFKKFFFATLIGTVVAAAVGIVLATNGFGVWALVFQSLINNLIDTLVLWVTVKWRPQKKFSWKSLSKLLKFGSKLLLSNLINTIWTDIRQLIIGKRYTSDDLAFYSKGNMFPATLVAAINSSIDSVLLPVMSKEQDNRDRVRNMTRRAIKTSSFFICPLMVGLAVCAEPIVRILLTEKWMEMVPYLRIFSIIYVFYPINASNINAIKAMGRSDVTLKLEIAKRTTDFVFIVISMWISVHAMAVFALVASLVNQILNCWPNRKLLNYGYFDQIKDLLPTFALTVLMGGVVYAVNILHIADIFKLLIQVPVGVVVYYFGAKKLKLESYSLCNQMFKRFLSREKRGYYESK